MLAQSAPSITRLGGLFRRAGYVGVELVALLQSRLPTKVGANSVRSMRQVDQVLPAAGAQIVVLVIMVACVCFRGDCCFSSPSVDPLRW
jgi:hypothetical protein